MNARAIYFTHREEYFLCYKRGGVRLTLYVFIFSVADFILNATLFCCYTFGIVLCPSLLGFARLQLFSYYSVFRCEREREIEFVFGERLL